MNLPSYAMDQASFPQMYERWLVVPLFRPWAETTVEELGLSAGDRVLDIACGTGIVARVAQQRVGAGARIVGIDISPGMLEVARAAAPGIDWREGNATALPLRDAEQFDAVICQQGLQFFADKPAAAAQMRRALAPGGKLAVSTWRSDDEIPFFRELRLVAQRHLGPIDDQRYGYGDAGPLEVLLRDAGFRDVRSSRQTRTMRFEDGESFVRMNSMALVGMSAAGKTMDSAERQRILQAIVSDSAPVLRAYTDASLVFELSTNLAMAGG
ncbi:MAG: methyltransferase domain-containing protein [Burkholderiaceae bacterium]|nr:methyltransferase domain-containing protein [Burkholderiaceae bacterium]